MYSDAGMTAPRRLSEQDVGRGAPVGALGSATASTANTASTASAANDGGAGNDAGAGQPLAPATAPTELLAATLDTTLDTTGAAGWLLDQPNVAGPRLPIELRLAVSPQEQPLQPQRAAPGGRSAPIEARLGIVPEALEMQAAGGDLAYAPLLLTNLTTDPTIVWLSCDAPDAVSLRLRSDLESATWRALVSVRVDLAAARRRQQWQGESGRIVARVFVITITGATVVPVLISALAGAAATLAAQAGQANQPSAASRPQSSGLTFRPLPPFPQSRRA